MAQSICFYFQVHQPFRLRSISTLEQNNCSDYFVNDSENTNQKIFEKVSQKCYLPTTRLLIELLAEYPDFHVSFSLSGVFIEQCEIFGKTGKEVLNYFSTLVKTNRVELLAETYYHSLAFWYSKLEFAEQVKMHRAIIKKHFGKKPEIFRNTELMYRDDLAEFVRLMGYRGILAEGWEPALTENNPNKLHMANPIKLGADDYAISQKYKINTRRKPVESLPVLTKNYRLSDDIAFRFGDAAGSALPLTAETFAEWVLKSPGDTVNLFMDFETFGEHQWAETGIFEFLKFLPKSCAEHGIKFRTPSQTLRDFLPQGVYHAPNVISWADAERDISAWLENDMQKTAFAEIKKFEALLHPLRNSKNPEILKCWSDFRKCQTSDHLYYMSTKFWADGDIHTYFSAYKNPYDAYINFMNALEKLKKEVDSLANSE